MQWFDQLVLIVFTGIMRCDFIAEGVIKATRELQLTIPLVVRLKGTKEVEAKQYALAGYRVVLA
jgi:succinyl-CoA synthetase beta subunit